MKANDADIPGGSPPVLFLIIDCLRADRAFQQAELTPTGFLGSLARRGRVFTSAVTVAPTTTPAVASMLTGLYPFEHGLRGLLGFTLPDGIPTVPRALRDVGYWTEADVTGPLLPQLRLFRDFDDFRWANRKEATIHGPRGVAFSARIRAFETAGRPWFSVFHVWDLHEPRQVPGGSAAAHSAQRSTTALWRPSTRVLPSCSLKAHSRTSSCASSEIMARISASSLVERSAWASHRFSGGSRRSGPLSPSLGASSPTERAAPRSGFSGSRRER